MRVVVVTHFVSPYHAELFNSIEASRRIDIEVVYLHRTHPTRDWAVPAILHKALSLDDGPDTFNNAKADVLRADLVVFSYYAERLARLLLNARTVSRQPWCFWGERPGLQKPKWLGRLRRRFILSPLHHSRAPIWGMGRFAVEGYKAEFGDYRVYNNIPYFSNLKRFRAIERQSKSADSDRMFLFSGSLIHRKGVDLLSRAFVRLARERPNVRLRLLGEGQLREAITKSFESIRDRVEFVGFRDWDQLPAYYSSADILCVPSRYDGWGVVVPEGLASGLPIIGTDQMGAAIEFIEPGRNGWLIPAGDENALYAALRDAALIPTEKLAEMSCLARDSVAEHSLQHGASRFIRAADDAVQNWMA